MQILKRKVRYTYQDYLQTPEDKKCELIDGDLYMTPSPLTVHQRVLRKIYDRLNGFMEGKDLGELFFAPIDVVLSDFDVLQPDLLFVCKERLSIVTEKNVGGAPDVVIEVLSPGTKERDLGIKRTTYERYGVREYWIADPDARTIEILQMTDDGLKTFRVFASGTRLKSPLLEGLQFSVDDIFR